MMMVDLLYLLQAVTLKTIALKIPRSLPSSGALRTLWTAPWIKWTNHVSLKWQAIQHGILVIN